MRVWLLFFLCSWALAAEEAEESIEEPIATWLTWQQAPESTMVVHWLTAQNDPSDAITLRKKGEAIWHRAEGAHTPTPQGHPYYIHAIEYQGLEANTLYEFKVKGQTYLFKTAPKKLVEPFTFVAGGDVYHDKVAIFEKMNRIVAAQNPLFIVIGGDIAYSCKKRHQKEETFERWLTWLASLSRSLITQERRLIPLVPAIGNHEVLGKGLQRPSAAAMFYHLFSLPENKGYRAVHFADYLSLYLLDSNHTHPIEGEQTAWLKQELSKRGSAPFKFASYHVPAYPAFRKYRLQTSQAIRKEWSPLFETYKLTAAFEHHDHLYKRTFLLKNNRKDPQGVLYIGDGAWGVSQPRTPNRAWYIAKAAPLRHVLRITVKPTGCLVEAVGEDGEVFDQITR